jgi:hypothetical protein
VQKIERGSVAKNFWLYKELHIYTSAGYGLMYTNTSYLNNVK